MNSFSLDAIDECRNKFDREGHPKFGIERKGRIYNCYVLPQSNEPALPDYTFSMATFPHILRDSEAPENITIFGVSDSIRENVRDLVGGHEVDEFTQIGANIRGCCRMASAMEIDRLHRRDDLEPREKIDYLEMRRNFFKNWIVYAASENIFPEVVEEFTNSLQLFEQTLSEAK